MDPHTQQIQYTVEDTAITAVQAALNPAPYAVITIAIRRIGNPVGQWGQPLPAIGERQARIEGAAAVSLVTQIIALAEGAL